MKNDIDLYSYSIGEGFPIMLIHGWCADGLSHLFQIPLAYQYRLLLPDLRGFGKSPKPLDDCTLNDLAADLMRFLEKKEEKKVIVYGCTFGGMVALQFALNHPELAEALILVNTAATAAGLTPFFENLAMLLRAPDGKDQLTHMMAEVLGVSEDGFSQSPAGIVFTESWIRRLGELETGPLAKLSESIKRFDVMHRLSEIRVPTLIVAANKDPFFPAAESQEMHNRIPAAEYVEIDAPHGASFLRPDLVNEAVWSFLEQTIAKQELGYT